MCVGLRVDGLWELILLGGWVSEANGRASNYFLLASDFLLEFVVTSTA